MKFPKVPTKNLDKSHLTEKEKHHSIALVLLGVMTMVIGLGLEFTSNIGLLVMIPVCIGTGIIGFVWGYIGAMEDERSGH